MQVETGLGHEFALVYAPAFLGKPVALQAYGHFAGGIAVDVEVSGAVSQVKPVGNRLSRAGVPDVGMVGALDLQVGTDLRVTALGKGLFPFVLRVQQVPLQVLQEIQAYGAAPAYGLVDVEGLHLLPGKRKTALEYLGS